MLVGSLTLSEARPVVVYLDRTGDPEPHPELETLLIVQAGARFSPPFSVATVGQTVEMRNDDTIFHNVFSYSAPNDFDFGVYPQHESRFHAFDSPGLVRFYCSIHDPMNGTLFVTPSPHFAIADETGGFRIDDVPAGEYTLHTWSPFLPKTRRRLLLSPGESISVELSVGEQVSAGAVPAAGADR